MAESVIWRGSTALVEQPNSPQWTFAAEAMAMTVHKGPFALCLSSAPRRGGLGTGDFAGLTVDEATVSKEKGGIGTLTVKYRGPGRAGDTQVPPIGNVEMQPEQGADLALEKHPRYLGLNENVVRACKAYVEAKDDGSAGDFLWVFEQPSPEGDLAEEFTRKLERGQTHFILEPPTVRWTEYSIEEPWADPGNYPEDPWGPITTPLGYEWLRRADAVKWNNGYWELTRSWRAALQIDTDIYPPEPY